MKINILLIYLLTCVSPVFGQSTLSKDVGLYLKNEDRYRKKALKVVKQNLKKTTKA